MKTILSNPKILVAGGLILSSLVCGLLVYNNSQLKDNLSSEKINSEKLLSEKLNLDKSLFRYKNELAELNIKNAALNKRIENSNKLIQSKTEEINQLYAQNASLKDIEKKMVELEQLKERLNSEIFELNKSLTQVINENELLNDQIAQSERINAKLSEDNSILKAMISDNYRTEALRGKHNRLTINARRTDKLVVSFDIPGSTSNDIYFKVITPKGDEFSSSKDLAATLKITEYGDGLLASSDPSATGLASTKRIDMSFKPVQRLTKGVYQFKIYNGERFIGSTQLRMK